VGVRLGESERHRLGATDLRAPDHTGAAPASAGVRRSSGNGRRARAAAMRRGC
jgi:hypothetical protein